MLQNCSYGQHVNMCTFYQQNVISQTKIVAKYNFSIAKLKRICKFRENLNHIETNKIIPHFLTTIYLAFVLLFILKHFILG